MKSLYFLIFLLSIPVFFIFSTKAYAYEFNDTYAYYNNCSDINLDNYTINLWIREFENSSSYHAAGIITCGKFEYPTSFNSSFKMYMQGSQLFFTTENGYRSESYWIYNYPQDGNEHMITAVMTNYSSLQIAIDGVYIEPTSSVNNTYLPLLNGQSNYYLGIGAFKDSELANFVNHSSIRDVAIIDYAVDINTINNWYINGWINYPYPSRTIHFWPLHK